MKKTEVEKTKEHFVRARSKRKCDVQGIHFMHNAFATCGNMRDTKYLPVTETVIVT